MMIPRKTVTPILAGCDMRRHGKAYLVTQMEKWLKEKDYPLSYFVYDPPILVEDASSWGLCSQGISYRDVFDDEGDVITHAMTIVGSDNYPNTADILEEWINGWASTLVPLMGNGIFRLTPNKSRLLVFHAGGWIDNYNSYRSEFLPVARPDCFLPDGHERDQHLAGLSMCAGLHWQHVIGGVRVVLGKENNRRVERTVGQTTYDAVCPIKTDMPKKRLALVAWRPIDEINLVDNEEIADKTPIDKALAFLTANSALQIPLFVTNN